MGEVASPTKINWLNTLFLIGMPIISVIGIVYHWLYFGPPGWTEAIVFFAMYYACGLSITAGYHRLFAHRSHKAAWPLVFLYAFFGAGAFQNSIIEWSSDHRNHHKFVDTDKDPYSASRGFFYSHMGWIMIEEDMFINDFSNIKDLDQSAIIKWQHRNIFVIGGVSGWILPALIGFALGGIPTAVGCLVYGGFLRTVFVHHGTFLINSAAHIWGTQPYSDGNSSKDSFWLAFFTFGEGYHNFHHQFQADYRNGIKWYQFDPTKWWIKTLSLIGITSDLKKTPVHSIEVSKLDMKYKKSARMLEVKDVDTTSFEERVNIYRESMRSAMFEMAKTRKELKENIAASKEALDEKIIELKKLIVAIKVEINKLFSDMHNAKTTLA
ncbi:MAG: acyl-CoA desaturase [Candidatus Poseidoniales archaeon]